MEDHPASNYSVLPKVTAKFKPPVRVAPLAVASSSKTVTVDAADTEESVLTKQAGISAASFYGSKKQQQLFVLFLVFDWILAD